MFANCIVSVLIDVDILFMFVLFLSQTVKEYDSAVFSYYSYYIFKAGGMGILLLFKPL